MNSGDSFAVRVLLDQCFDRDNIEVDARIEGVKNIENADKWVKRYFFKGLGLGAISGIVSGIVVAFFLGELALVYLVIASAIMAALFTILRFHDRRPRGSSQPR